MKVYLFLSALIINLNAFAMSFDEECQLLRGELTKALSAPHLNSKYLFENNLIKCFSAKMLVTNNAGDRNYTGFMDILNDATTDILQIMAISEQVDASIAHVNGPLEKSRNMVGAINVWQFFMHGEKFHAVLSGFGDEDCYYTTVFKGEDTQIVLMGAE